MALSFFSNRITGNQGRGTVVSFSDGLLTATEDTTSNFADAGNTNFAGMQYKRLMLLVDGTNSRWVGWGYVASRLSDSGDNQRFQMDEIIDVNGDTTHFINFKGESVTPTTSHDAILSACLQDLDLSSTDNNILENASKTTYTLSGTPSGTGDEYNGTVFFGSSAAGDQDGLVMHNEFTTIDTGTALTNARHARFGLEGGFTSWTRILNYQTSSTTGNCHIVHPTTTTTGTRDIFSYGNVVNTDTVKGTAVVWGGSILADNGGRFPGNTGVRNAQSQDNVEIGASLFINLQTNCDIITGADGSQLPTSGITGDWGGPDNNILRRVESNQYATNGINVRFWGTIQESNFVSYNAGTSLSGTGADAANTATTPYVFGDSGTTYTDFPLFEETADSDFPFFWRTGPANRNIYLTVVNTNSTDRTARYNEGTFSNTEDWHDDWRCRWRYEGTWTGLDADETLLYATYDNSSASTLSETFFANEWDNFKPTVNSDGTATVGFTQAIYAGNGDDQWTTRTDNGYREIDPDNTDDDNRGLATTQTGWTYSLKGYGYTTQVFDISEVDKSVGGVEVKAIEVAGNVSGNSLSGGFDSDGNNQVADANITNGKDIEGETFAKSHVASLMGTVSGGAYPNLTKSANTGDVTYTFNDAGLVGISNNLDHISLDELYAMMHYLYAVPADDTEGYKHLVMPVTTVTDNRWKWQTFDTDTDVTAIVFRTDSDDSTNKVSAKNSTIKGIDFDGGKSAIDLNDFVLGDGLFLVSSNADDNTSSFVQLEDDDDIWTAYNASSKAIGDVTLRGRVDANIGSGNTYNMYFDPDATHNIYKDSSTKFQLRNIGAGTLNVYGLTPNSSGIRDHVDASFYSSGTGAINFRKEIEVTFEASDAITLSATKAQLKIRAFTKDSSDVFTEHTVADADITTSDNTWKVSFDIPADETLYYAAHLDVGASFEKFYPVNGADLSVSPSENVVFEAIPEVAIPENQLDAGSIAAADITVTEPTSATADIVVSIDGIKSGTDIADLTNDEARYFFANILCRDDEWLDGIAKEYIHPQAITYNGSYVVFDDDHLKNGDDWRLQMNTDETRSFLEFQCVAVDNGEKSLQYALTDRSGTNANRLVIMAIAATGMTLTQLKSELDDRAYTKANMGRLGRLKATRDIEGNKLTGNES